MQTVKKLDLENLVLKSGSHSSPAAGMCVMEAVAFVAGEPHSDHPECASAVIGAFMRTWNDDLDDEGRQRLKPYILKLVGTKASAEIEDARGWLAADWLVRTHTAAWLELAGLKEHAEALRALPELRDPVTLEGSRPTLAEARKKEAAAGAAAWDAARDAAGDAAWDAARAAAWAAARAAARAAAWDAARAAAWDAAWDAARAAARAAAWDAAGDAARAAAWDAAWDAAGDAAWDAAWDAAGDAARAAAKKKLEPTRVSLQESAFQLLDRMIALGKAA
jgi:hypothetical protein